MSAYNFLFYHNFSLLDGFNPWGISQVPVVTSIKRLDVEKIPHAWTDTH